MTDKKSKFFFFTGENQDMLAYIKEMLTNGFVIPYGERGMKFKFIGYSSSQLKNHSFWFMGGNSSE
jgi:hypothetical protein